MSEREIEDIYKRGYRHGRKDAIEVACRWIESYLFDIGFPDDWCRDSATMKSGKERTGKFGFSMIMAM